MAKGYLELPTQGVQVSLKGLVRNVLDIPQPNISVLY